MNSPRFESRGQQNARFFPISSDGTFRDAHGFGDFEFRHSREIAHFNDSSQPPLTSAFTNQAGRLARGSLHSMLSRFHRLQLLYPNPPSNADSSGGPSEDADPTHQERPLRHRMAKDL